MRRPECGIASKPQLAVLVGIIATAAWSLVGCSSHGGDLISTVALPSEQSVAAAENDDFAVAAPPDAGRLSATADLTPNQRGYLDALLAVGVHPANELRALSIGAYVCQARAAGQSDQAVWDSVAPMVRSDLSETHGMEAPEVGYRDVDATIGHYIGIATQRLC